MSINPELDDNAEQESEPLLERSRVQELAAEAIEGAREAYLRALIASPAATPGTRRDAQRFLDALMRERQQTERSV